jgi:hypothetical protein
MIAPGLSPALWPQSPGNTSFVGFGGGSRWGETIPRAKKVGDIPDFLLPTADDRVEYFSVIGLTVMFVPKT